MNPDNSKEVICVGYPRPSQEPQRLTVKDLDRDLELYGARPWPSKFLTPSGQEIGAGEIIDRAFISATLAGIVALAALSAAVLGNHVTLSGGPNTHQLLLYFFGAWLLGVVLACAGKLRLLGWVVALVTFASACLGYLYASPYITEAMTYLGDKLVNALIGPNPFA